MEYGIEAGQIYIAADGSKCGHIVTDTMMFAECDDIVTTPFAASRWGEPGNRIDAFKLARVRYSLAAVAPDWMPPNALGNRRAAFGASELTDGLAGKT